MVRTNVDIDEKACAKVMRRYKLASKEEAINLALRKVATEPFPFKSSDVTPMSLEEARAMRGVGWDGDLDEMRSSRLTP